MQGLRIQSKEKSLAGAGSARGGVIVQTQLELISFALCSYVQRSVITLLYKKAEFKTTYIDLESPPEWFNRISPLGKVPLLRVNEDTVLFESAIINEYIDETVGTPVTLRDPLAKARERAWIEFGSEMLGELYSLTLETDLRKASESKKDLFDALMRVEDVVSEGPTFRGQDFSLVDAAFAPLFMRIFLSKELKDDPRWQQIPKTRKWADHLNSQEFVKKSVPDNFEGEYIAYCKRAGSLIY